MKQGGPPLAGGALRNVAEPVAFKANHELPPAQPSPSANKDADHHA